MGRMASGAAVNDVSADDMLLTFDGVELGYAGRTVLHALHLALQRGRWIALAGPNASGKTTLLRCAAGLLPSPRGSVGVEAESLYPLRGRQELPGYAVAPEELPPFLTLRQ